jgi:hypothetical protein
VRLTGARPQSATRRANRLGNIRSLCPAPFAKIFWFSEDPNHLIIVTVLSHRGAAEIVTDAGQDAVDASGAKDEGAFLVDGEVVWF